MRFIFSLPFLLIAIAQPAIARDSCKSFEFRTVKTLSVQDIGRLSTSEVVGTIAISWFDSEDRPRLHGRGAQTFLLFRTGDLGEMPVAGILYANGPVEIVNRENAEGVSAVTFATGEPSCKLTLSVQNDGRVTAGDRSIGRMH